MKAVGVIVEYNPFHNGHLYHLQQTKKISKADVVIAVMSGNFLQRGEPALVSKWSRAKMALKNGADIVVELPFAYSTQKAETFAFGAISILNALGASFVCFGSESGNINDFFQAVDDFVQNETDIDEKLKQYLKQGYSYPKAMSLATEQTPLLSAPNNILGFHYVKAIKNMAANIEPLTIQRKAAQYHDKTFATEKIASATSIRNILKENGLSAIKNVVPSATFAELSAYYEQFQTFSDWEKYFPFLKYKILSTDERMLGQIYGMAEGIEYRLKKNIAQAKTFQHFMENIKTKRYTWTRLQRLLLYVLTNATDDEMMYAEKKNHVPYIRLLGMNQTGQKYLNELKHRLTIPLVTKPKEFDHPLLSLDIRATMIYSLIYPQEQQSAKGLNDFQTPPVQIT